MIKRFLTFFLALLLAASLAGCTDSEIADGAVVCSAFPEYDFARQICGDVADVVMLLPCGSEAHDFEPTAKDIKAVAAASLFIYNGGESEVWVERVLLSAGNVRSISLIDCCTSPLYVDGEDGREQDEHIWTSPKNATLMAEKIYNVLCEVFPGKKDVLESNYNALSAKLTALDNACTEMGNRMKGKTVIIGDRNPFGYLARDYGVEMMAAFHGCGHDSEPSAKELASLIETAKENDADTVFYVDFSGGKIARTVASELENAKTEQLFSCHNVTAEDFMTKSYYDLMMQNISRIIGAEHAAD